MANHKPLAILTDDVHFDPTTINMDEDFMQMHVHTRYSAKDALCKLNTLTARLKELGYKAFSVTEHGVLYSAIEAVKAAKAEGLKYIPGCEVYETDDRTHHQRAGQEVYHFLLLAANDQGYKDLMTIVSDAGTVGKFDDNERTDFDFIEKNGLGLNLIATSACLGGRIAQHLMAGDYNSAKAVAMRLKHMFLAFYLELQDNGIKEQDIVNMQLVRLSEETGIPLVVTSDVHYVYQEDGDIHDTLICIGFNNKKHDCQRYRYQGNYPYFVRSPRELYDWAQANNIPVQAVYNTKLIADFCDVTIPMGLDLLPEFPTPKGYDPNQLLEHLCYGGLETFAMKKAEAGEPIDMLAYMDRLEMELSVIKMKGFPSYFLSLWDFVQFLNREKIFLGPGRGSAAGALIAFTLGITKLDPIEHGFQFERFLNPERMSMPDIDIDIPDIHRAKCIDYIKQKYGQENVGQIITFGEIGVKSGIRDLGRVLEIDPQVISEMCEMIPSKMPDQSDVDYYTLMDIATDENAAEKYGQRAGGIVDIARRFKEYMEEFPEINTALQGIEGCIRNKGIHAGGVIICKDKISNYAPIEKGSDTAVLDIVAFDMGTCEEIGLLKMDFLGLRTLSVVAMTLEHIENTTGEVIDLYEIGRKDPEVYKMIRDGYTHGIFQISGNAITKYTKQVKPVKFAELIDILALFRPGPLEAEVAPGITMTERYVQNGEIDERDWIQEIHPDLQEILRDTRGVMVYQEQIMATTRKMAGYTLGAADSFRRVIGKKKIKEVGALRWQFLYGKDALEKCQAAYDEETDQKKKDLLGDQLLLIKKSPVSAPGALALGYDPKFALEIFEQLAKFAGYGFNKPHSGCYADLAYQTAWLKVHYPVQFMAGQMTSEADDQEKTIANIAEAKRLGITILPPDINKSEIGYTIERTKVYDEPGDEASARWILAIRMGLLSIKGVGGGVIDEVTKARNALETKYVVQDDGQITDTYEEPIGDFKDFNDVYNRISARVVNRSYMEKLILSGVFDAMEPNRYKLLNHFFFNIRRAKPYGGTVIEYLEAKASKDKTLKPKDNEYPMYPENGFTDEIKLQYEKDFIGAFISGHPLEELPYKAWSTVLDNEPLKMGGRIKSIKKLKTKGGTGAEMAFVKLETQGEDIDCTLFPRQYAEYKDRLYKDNIVIMKGKKQVQQNGKEGLLVDDILLPRKNKFKVDNLDDDDDEATDIPSEPKPKKQRQLAEYANDAREDPLAALFAQ